MTPACYIVILAQAWPPGHPLNVGWPKIWQTSRCAPLGPTREHRSCQLDQSHVHSSRAFYSSRRKLR